MAYSQEMEDEQQSAFNPNQQQKKHNKFNALAATYQQSKSVAKPLPGANKQAVTQGQVQTQNTASTAAAQKGDTTKQQTADKTGAYVVGGAAPVGNNLSQGVKGGNAFNSVSSGGDYSHLSDEQIQAAHAQNNAQEDANTGILQQNLAAEQERIGDHYKQQYSGLSDFYTGGVDELNAMPQQEVADIGAQSALEQEAMDTNQVLADGNKLGALSRFFQQGYDPSRFGGLDSQIYNQQLNEAQELGKQNIADSTISQQRKQASIEKYLNDLDDSRSTYDKFVDESESKLNDYRESDSRALKDASQQTLDGINSRRDQSKDRVDSIYETRKQEANKKAEEEATRKAWEKTMAEDKAAKKAKVQKRLNDEAAKIGSRKGFSQW